MTENAMKKRPETQHSLVFISILIQFLLQHKLFACNDPDFVPSSVNERMLSLKIGGRESREQQINELIN